MSKTKEQKKPGKWFNGVIYEKGAVVQNRFGGGEIELNNVELSMYDFVIGASILMETTGPWGGDPKIIRELRKGLYWFIKHNSEAYMVLLD